MKPRTVIALTGALLLGSISVASAQDEGDENLVPSSAPASPRIFGDGEMPEFVRMFDVDEDNRLSAEEAQALRDVIREKRDEFLTTLDRDGDGRLSAAERLAALAEIRKRILERRSERFEEADTDGDGCVSESEFLVLPHVANLPVARAKAIFAHLDRDGDGCMTVEEFLRTLPPIGPPPREGDGEEEAAEAEPRPGPPTDLGTD